MLNAQRTLNTGNSSKGTVLQLEAGLLILVPYGSPIPAEKNGAHTHVGLYGVSARERLPSVRTDHIQRAERKKVGGEQLLEPLSLFFPIPKHRGVGDR